MSWNDDSWRDGYDEWKLRSPYDDYDDEEPCDHEDYSIDIVTGEWSCDRCDYRRAATSEDIEMECRRQQEYSEMMEREERRQWWRDLFWPVFWLRHKISAGWPWLKRKPGTDDEIPF